jgi:putative redox protein
MHRRDRALVAAQCQWPVDHVEVVVDYAKKQPPGASATADIFSKTIFLRVPRLDEEQRGRLLDVASRCPTQRVLEGAPMIPTARGKPIYEVFDR